MKERMRAAVEDAMRKTPPEIPETVPKPVEMDTKNYGAPPENSGIAAYTHGMTSPKASLTEPQAWQDEFGNWFYNFAGAIQLEKVLGRTLPSISQLLASIKANPDKFRKRAGFRSVLDSRFHEGGEISLLWSSSDDGKGAYYAYLKKGYHSAYEEWIPRNFGLAVRFIVDKK